MAILSGRYKGFEYKLTDRMAEVHVTEKRTNGCIVKTSLFKPVYAIRADRLNSWHYTSFTNQKDVKDYITRLVGY